MNELISVIVPVYKVEGYLERCINSILNQTYQEFELILVDDGSPDRCGLICDQYAMTDRRIRVIHKENGGLSSARNRGLDIAAGKYIVFVDSDDYVSVSYLENLYKAARQESCEIVQCKYVATHSGEVDLAPCKFLKSDVSVITKREALNQRKYKVCSWGSIYSSKLFQNIRFTEQITNEDEDIYYRLIYYADKIGILNEVLYYYYLSENSIMRNSDKNKKIDFIKVNERRIQFFQEKGERELLEGSYTRYCLSVMFFLASAKVRKHNKADIPLLWEKFKQYYRLAVQSKHTSAFDKMILTCYRAFPFISNIIICIKR